MIGTDLRSLKDIWSQKLAALGDNASAIENSYRDAQAVIRLHALRMNDFNIIASLPVDVLEIVFLFARDDCLEPHGPNASWTTGSKWLIVTHVCHHWREVSE